MAKSNKHLHNSLYNIYKIKSMENIEDFILSGNFKEGMAEEHARLRKELDKVRIELTMGGYHDGWSIIALKERRLNIIQLMNDCIDLEDRK
jgi:hypothetical protein